MYNRLYKYLTTEKLLFSKQFVFQTGLSIEHEIVNLVDQIYKSFEKDHYTLGVFIDLSKAFDTVDLTILIRKLEMYGIKGINLAWFRSYLTNRIQYISILGPLLFLLYVNDLHNSSALDPIMFADDTDLFYEHKDLKTLFSLVNQERFEANKLSYNVGKTKYSLFHKPSRKDVLLLLLPSLLIKKHKVERVKSIKFLGVLLDENLSWKDHIKYIENKVAKNIDLLHRAKLFLDKNSLRTLYYSYIHTYLNYANLSWGSTNRTNLKKLLSQQKDVVQIINNRTRFDHTNELFKSQKILNIYKLNILSVAVFMYQIRNKTAPLTFSGPLNILKICHVYPTNISQFNYKIPKTALSKSKFRISFRGPSIWNNFLQNSERQIESLPLFKSKLKLKRPSSNNEITSC